MSNIELRTTVLHAGGLEATLVVPCAGGPVELTLRAERDRDGDWRVFIPWPEVGTPGMPEVVQLGDGVEVANGILYLASDEEGPSPLLCLGCGESLGAIDVPDEGGAAHPECVPPAA